MSFANAPFWLFLATVCVASLTFVTVIVWAENRRKERKEFYRFEFRKKLVESGKMDASSFASLIQYENDIRLLQARQKLLIGSFVILGTGIGVCFGFQFISGSVWKLGLIPVSIGLSMLVYGLFLAPKTNPGPPPLGASLESDERN